MADASSNIDVFEDDFLGRDYRSTLYTLTKVGPNIPADPTVETSGSEQVNGAMRIDTQTGAGRIEVDSLPLSNVLVSKKCVFWGSFKIPAFSSSEYDSYFFGLRAASSFDAGLLIDASYDQTNYRIVTRPNSSGSIVYYDTGVALPTGGASSGWMDISFTTYGTGEDAEWQLASEHVVQASGTVPSTQVPTIGLNFHCRALKDGTGTRSTQLYTDVWRVAQDA